MYEDSSPIGSLVHLYFDGAFSRRELVRRVAGHTGSIAAAAAVLTSMGVAAACDAWGRTIAWFDKFLKSKMASA
jgi:butyrate kinase